EKVGARVGWIRVDTFGHLKHLPAKSGKAGDVPAFRFHPWEKVMLTKPPPPAVPFGLDLSYRQITDVELKGLAGLRSLHTLNLYLAKVTDAGLNELAALKSL